MALFTPEELEELRRADEEIEANFRLTIEDLRRSRQLDRDASSSVHDVISFYAVPAFQDGVFSHTHACRRCISPGWLHGMPSAGQLSSFLYCPLIPELHLLWGLLRPLRDLRLQKRKSCLRSWNIRKQQGLKSTNTIPYFWRLVK